MTNNHKHATNHSLTIPISNLRPVHWPIASDNERRTLRMRSAGRHHESLTVR